MGLTNFLKGIVAQITPSFIDHGKTYGSYNPPKKKLQPGDPGYVAPAPAPQTGQSNTPNNQIQVKTQTPENLFSGLNNNLRLPGSTPNTNLQVKPVSTPVLTPPAPGTVVTPHQQVQPQPAPTPQKQGLFGKIGGGLETAAKTAIGTVANVPELGLATARAASGLAQGVTQLPHLVTAAAATGTQALNRLTPDSSVSHALNTGVQSLNTGVKSATGVVNKPFDFVNHGLDQAAQSYADHVPAAAAGQKVYTREQVPLNILAAIATLGAGAAPEAGADASKIGQVSRFLNKPITSNPDNVVAKTAQAVGNKVTPVVESLNNPFGAARNILGNFTPGRVVPIERGTVDAGEAGNLGADVGNATQIPVGTGIDVTSPTTTPTPVPVRTPPAPLIQEIGGDASNVTKLPTLQEIEQNRAANRFQNQDFGSPDNRIEGVTHDPSQIVTTQDKANVQDLLNEKLQSNEITPEQHQALSDELKQIPAADAPVPKGQPIQVKSVDSIPIQNQTDVPTGLPETPGQVRPTTATAPTNVETQAVANAPVVASPAPLPKETQNVLDNPRQFSKAQVAAARNQAKLAKQYAKTQENTAEALSRIETAKPTSEKGFVPSGELRRGRNGNISEVAHKDLEAAQGAHDTANLSVNDVLNNARDEVAQNGIHSPATVRNLKALRDSGTLDRSSPEFKAVNEEYKSAISNHARALSMTDRAARTTATGDQLTNRFTSKLLSAVEDTGKVKDSDISQITEAENAFTEARDNANALAERFKSTGSDSDFKAWKTAQQQAEDADREAKMIEYVVSKRVLEGNKNPEASKAIQEAEKNAGIYSMDSIDANMLSGTGTMVRNYINTLFPRTENKLFGRISSRLVKPIATVGGSSGRGERIGAAIGKAAYKADLAARKDAGVGRIRRVVTAGNTVGEKNIEATTYSKAFDHYKQMLQEEGYKGKELNNRAEFNVRTDPDKLVEQYRSDTLQANALSSLTHGTKIENVLSNAIQQKLADAGIGAKGQNIGKLGAKTVTRVGLGFPTVIAKSLVEGLKRATLGIPEAGWSTLKYLKTGNADQYAGELSKAMQHAGSGGSLILLGNALGKAGAITGAYPTDPAERARWTAEGKQENSIKIGGQWFSIPGYLGGFALPLMLGASTADGGIKDEASLKNAWSTILSASPVDNVQSTLQILTGTSSDAQNKNALTSIARAVTPAGSFVAELAKLTDRTQNDTTTKGTVQNILDSVAAGIPGLNNKVNTTDKTDSYGNVLKNPNPIAQVLGAQGVSQDKGTADVKEAQNNANAGLEQLNQIGVTSNKNLMQLVDPKLRKQIEDGKPLTPEDLTKVQKAVTKGITPTEDSNWRENSDYATDKAALQTKLQVLEADPTTKPSVKQEYQTQIRRDDVLDKNKISYDQLKQYESTSVSDWRAMGDPKSDTYDPDTYQALWNIDKALTEGNASYNKQSTSKQKYSAKSSTSGSSSGGRSSKSYSSDFGTLKAGAGAPTVQQYQSIDQSSGQVPVIQVQRPNIVHKISSSG